MRNLSHLDSYRMPLMGNMGDEYNGAFKLKIKGEEYTVIASNGHEWEHVSISSRYKVPSWTTMCALKDLFFEPEEVVMQLHPKQSEYVNIHERCLHLWRPLHQEIPTPPSQMVGIK